MATPENMVYPTSNMCPTIHQGSCGRLLRRQSLPAGASSFVTLLSGGAAAVLLGGGVPGASASLSSASAAADTGCDAASRCAAFGAAVLALLPFLPVHACTIYCHKHDNIGLDMRQQDISHPARKRRCEISARRGCSCSLQRGR